MAKIGLKFPVASPITGYSKDGMPIYGTGFIIGKAVSAEKSVECNDNQLPGDDAIAESDTSFASGGIKLGVTDFGSDYLDSLQVQAKMLGHTVVDGKTIQRGALDIAPYLGFGYYKTKIQNNKRYYEATWLYKSVFKVPSESTNTKGKSIEWQTPEIEGSFMAVEGYGNDNYEDTEVFETEQEARSWLINKSHCESLGDMSSLTALITEYKAFSPETYTSASWGVFYAKLTKVSETVSAKSYMGTGEISYWTSQLTNANANLIERSA